MVRIQMAFNSVWNVKHVKHEEEFVFFCSSVHVLETADIEHANSM